MSDLKFKLNTGADIPAVGLGMYTCTISLGDNESS